MLYWVRSPNEMRLPNTHFWNLLHSPCCTDCVDADLEISRIRKTKSTWEFSSGLILHVGIHVDKFLWRLQRWMRVLEGQVQEEGPFARVGGMIVDEAGGVVGKDEGGVPSLQDHSVHTWHMTYVVLIPSPLHSSSCIQSVTKPQWIWAFWARVACVGVALLPLSANVICESSLGLQVGRVVSPEVVPWFASSNW